MLYPGVALQGCGKGSKKATKKALDERPFAKPEA